MNLKASSELHMRASNLIERWQVDDEVGVPAPDHEQTVEAWNGIAQSPTLVGVQVEDLHVFTIESPVDETRRILADHPDLPDRLARFERDGSVGRPLREVMNELDADG